MSITAERARELADIVQSMWCNGSVHEPTARAIKAALEDLRAMWAENEKLRADLNEAHRDRDTMSALNRTAEEERDAARAEVEGLKQELDSARETNNRLNRRCQVAESAARDNVQECKRQGVSLGRDLARFAALDAMRETERLRQELISMNEAAADAVSNAHGQGQENALADIARELGWGEWPKDGWERLAGLRQRREGCEFRPGLPPARLVAVWPHTWENRCEDGSGSHNYRFAVREGQVALTHLADGKPLHYFDPEDDQLNWGRDGWRPTRDGQPVPWAELEALARPACQPPPMLPVEEQIRNLVDKEQRAALERDALGAQLLDVQRDCIELCRRPQDRAMTDYTYPGHPIVLALAIVTKYPSLEAAEKRGVEFPAALEDTDIPGAGGNVHAALDMLRQFKAGGLCAAAAASWAADYWACCDNQREHYPAGWRKGQQEADAAADELWRRLETWPEKTP